MTITGKLKKLFTVISNPLNSFQKSNYIFILSHMRSRSTVLSHILGSNPEIIGYSELQLAYANKLSILNMKVKLMKEFKIKFRNKYLLDKILHNHFSISPRILTNYNPKIIILLRKPEDTLKSLYNLSHKNNLEKFKDTSVALEYYCSRLNEISQFAISNPKKYFLIESDELVTNSDVVLQNLSKWLNLSNPLVTVYSQFKNTGIRRHGDSSANINAGVLKKTPKYNNIEIPSTVFEKAQTSYENCLKTLKQNS